MKVPKDRSCILYSLKASAFHKQCCVLDGGWILNPGSFLGVLPSLWVDVFTILPSGHREERRLRRIWLKQIGFWSPDHGQGHSLWSLNICFVSPNQTNRNKLSGGILKALSRKRVLSVFLCPALKCPRGWEKCVFLLPPISRGLFFWCLVMITLGREGTFQGAQLPVCRSHCWISKFLLLWFM